MSDERIIQAIKPALEEWWQHLRPAHMLNEAHNFNEIGDALFAYAKSRGGNIGVDDVQIVVAKLGDIERGGRLRYYHEPATQTTPALSNPADTAPYLDESMLKNVTSLSAVAAMTAAQVKVFATSDARHEYDKNGNKIVSLNQKFNERLAWLQAHPDVDLADTLARIFSKPQPQTVVRTRIEDPRVQQIREQLEKESRGYTAWAHSKRERLNRALNELLSDPSRQIYRDRSRGGIEVIKGLDAVERLMTDAIRDADNPIK